MSVSKPEDILAIAASGRVRNLTTLDLGDNGVGLEGGKALAASECLRNLTVLDLWDNRIGPAGAQALAASPHLRNLTTLIVCGNHSTPRLNAAIESGIEGCFTAEGRNH